MVATPGAAATAQRRDQFRLNRSSYYKWHEAAEAARRERADAALAERIRAAHAEADGAYGSLRVTAELRTHCAQPAICTGTFRAHCSTAITGSVHIEGIQYLA